MTDQSKPNPFGGFRRLPDTLTRSGLVVRTPMSTHYTRAAIEEYRSIAGKPSDPDVIVDAPSSNIQQTPQPERVNNGGVVVARPARLTRT